MGTRIVEFGVFSSDILAAFAGNGYGVDACRTSVPKLKQALQRQDGFDAIAVAENGASEVAGILTTGHSVGKVPLILFQDGSRTCDPSQFDLVVPENAPLSDPLQRVAALIEQSRGLRGNTKTLAERYHFWLRTTISLRERSVAACVDSQRIRTKRRRSETERVGIPCVLVVDDCTQWRDKMCSILDDHADCQLLCEARDGIEAVQRAER